VTGYSTDGKDLTVTYQGGVCADYAASASESAGRVTVTVTETTWQGKVCIMVAKVYHRTLHLRAPLGDREVVGPDGKRIPRETAGALPGAAPRWPRGTAAGDHRSLTCEGGAPRQEGTPPSYAYASRRYVLS
jgi:hypothetical protein